MEKTMEEVLDKMAECLCDEICKYPEQLSNDDLDDVCDKCPVNAFICDITYLYNKVRQR